MKHFIAGVLFLLFLFTPPLSFAAINITISDLTKKDDYYELNALVTGMSGTSKTFVEGMFTSPNDNNYFGYTLSNKGGWLIYDGSPDKTLVTENFIELFNDTVQKIYIKPDYEDKDYVGPGKYLVKLKRFTASGSPSDYSNILEIDLVNTAPTPTLTATTQLTPTSTTTPFIPTSSPSPTSTSTPKVSTVTPPQSTPSKSSTPTPTSSTTIVSKTTPTAVISSSEPETGVQPVITPANQSTSSPQVLSATTSVDNIVIPASTSSFPISDKNLFLVGMTVFSVSGGVLYFRLKNL